MSKELENAQQLRLIWSYEIDAYKKMPIVSEQNSLTLLGKICQRLIKPGQTTSTLEQYLNQDWRDLHNGNTLVRGQILQEPGWWACFGASVLYRSLLNAGIPVSQRKGHSIYYTNIFLPGQIGLDATVSRDDTYRIDLIFTNNQSDDIMCVVNQEGRHVRLNRYGKEQYVTHLEPLQTGDISAIKWHYTIKNQSGDLLHQEDIVTSYDKVDMF